MSEYDVVNATHRPVTEDLLVSDLRAVGVQEGTVLLVHSSLSTLGWVSGGPLTVVRALRKAVGDAGTLVMPTQSAGLSDPSRWKAPAVPESWWQVIRDTMPAYDRRLTPTRAMGAIAETFRSLPDAVRSSHPAFSFSAAGALSRQVVADHQLDDGLGERTPLGALYVLDASVLLLGVGFENCTALHLAERRALGGAQPTVAAGAPMMVNGVREWVEFREPHVSFHDFAALGTEFERVPDVVATARVGMATARLFRLRALVDFGVPWFKRNRL